MELDPRNDENPSNSTFNSSVHEAVNPEIEPLNDAALDAAEDLFDHGAVNPDAANDDAADPRIVSSNDAGGRSRRALFLATVAVACWSFVNMFVDLNQVFDPSWINAFIFVVATVFNVSLFAARKQLGLPTIRLSPKHRLVAFSLPSIDLVGYTLIFYAMEYCPIGDAVALFSLMVIWTPLVESVLTRKFPSKQLMASLSIAVAGIVLLTRPSFIFGSISQDFFLLYPNYKRAYLLSVLGSFCFTASINLLGQFKEIHWVVWQWAYTPAGLVVIPITMYILNGTDLLAKVSVIQWTDIFRGFLVGILDLLARIFNILSVQEGSSSMTAIGDTLEIPFTYIHGVIFLNQTPTIFSSVGSLLVCAAILILADVPSMIQRFLTKIKRYFTSNNEGYVSFPANQNGVESSQYGAINHAHL